MAGAGEGRERALQKEAAKERKLELEREREEKKERKKQEEERLHNNCGTCRKNFDADKGGGGCGCIWSVNHAGSGGVKTAGTASANVPANSKPRGRWAASGTCTKRTAHLLWRCCSCTGAAACTHLTATHPVLDFTRNAPRPTDTLLLRIACFSRLCVHET